MSNLGASLLGIIIDGLGSGVGFYDMYEYSVEFYDMYKHGQKQKPQPQKWEKKEQCYKDNIREGEQCMKCYEIIPRGEGTRELKCRICRRTMRNSPILYHEACSEIGVCDNCSCSVCDELITDWKFEYIHCSICNKRNFRVHDDCSKEVKICEECLQRETFGKCHACSCWLTRHQLKNVRCQICEEKQFIVHSVCAQKVIECEACLSKNKVCQACGENILASEPRFDRASCSICGDPTCLTHLDCCDKTILCEGCWKRECPACHQDIKQHDSKKKKSCSTCESDLLVHANCSSATIDCAECVGNKVTGDCLICSEVILRRHQTKEANCSFCKEPIMTDKGRLHFHKDCDKPVRCRKCINSKTPKECFVCNKSVVLGHTSVINCATCKSWRQVVYNGCLNLKNITKETAEYPDCMGNKVTGVCLICNEVILQHHETKEANCSLCKAPVTTIKACLHFHKDCDKVMKCPTCVDYDTPNECFVCNKSVVLGHTSVINCATCKSWRQVVHNGCLNVKNITKETAECPDCMGNKITGVCLICNEVILQRHETKEANCSLCNAPLTSIKDCLHFHKDCDKVMKCPTCVDYDTPEKCFFCNKSVVSCHTSVVNCAGCQRWRQVVHNGCLKLNKTTKDTTRYCPECTAEV